MRTIFLFGLLTVVASPANAADADIVSQLACTSPPEVTVLLDRLVDEGRIAMSDVRERNAERCWLAKPALSIGGVTFSFVCMEPASFRVVTAMTPGRLEAWARQWLTAEGAAYTVAAARPIAGVVTEGLSEVECSGPGSP